jgi:hypothetical protein
MSATGSVNLIVCFSSSHPFAPRPAENLQRLVFRSFLVQVLVVFDIAQTTEADTTDDALPRRLRNPRNLPPQGELPKAQAANAELAQEAARTPAELAAVVLARGKLGFPGLFLMQPNSVFHSFCCSSHSILVCL